MTDEPKEFWFNTHTREVEVGKQVAALFRIGPFDSAEEAAKAPEIVAARAKAWAAEDASDEPKN